MGELPGSDEVRAGLWAPGYRVERLIGSGAFGSVYLAEQVSTHREVALKVLSVGLGSPRDEERFDEEVRTLARLDSHPHVVDLIDYGLLSDGRPFFAMRFSPDGSVADESGRSEISPSRAIEVGVGVASALSAAHAREVLHRDVKPANVLLSATGAPLLADFGVAIARARAEQATGAFTNGYAAPEVLAEESYSPASDQYALGISLYELLTGQRPFRSTTIAGLADEVRFAPPPPIDRDDLPAGLVGVVHRAMAKRPEDRFASVTELAQALQEVEASRGLRAPTLAVWRAPAPVAPASVVVSDVNGVASADAIASVVALDGVEPEATVLRGHPPDEETTRRRRAGIEAEDLGAADLGAEDTLLRSRVVDAAVAIPPALAVEGSSSAGVRRRKRVPLGWIAAAAVTLAAAGLGARVMTTASPGASAPTLAAAASSDPSTSRSASASSLASLSPTVSASPSVAARTAAPISPVASRSAAPALSSTAPRPRSSTASAATPRATASKPTPTPSAKPTASPTTSTLQTPRITRIWRSGTQIKVSFTQAAGGGVSRLTVNLGDPSSSTLLRSIPLDYVSGQSSYTVSFSNYYCTPPSTKVLATVQAFGTHSAVRTSPSSSSIEVC